MVIYTRVSTDKKEQKLSLKVQRDYYEDYANKKNHKLLHIYADEGFSGTNVRREQFKQMLYDAGLDYVKNDSGSDQFNISNRVPKFELIVVKDASRFSRNVVQGLDIVNNLKSKGVEVLFENAGLSSFDNNNDIILPFLFTMAEAESRNTGKKISFTKKHQAKNGVYKPAIVPLGFKRADDKSLIIDHHEAEIVKWIFNRFLDVGAKTVAYELNQQGLKSKTHANFAATTINRMIRNPIYYGDVLFNKKSKKNVTDTKLTKNNPEDYILIENAVEPIIDKALWNECNAKADERTNVRTKRGRKPAINDLFSQKLICSQCGKQFTRHKSMGGKKITYICITRRLKSMCNAKSIVYNQLKLAMAEIDIDHGQNFMMNHQDYHEIKRAISKLREELTTLKTEITSRIEKLEQLNKTSTNMMIEMFQSEGDEEIVNNIKESIKERSEEIKHLKFQDAQLNVEYLYQFETEVEEKFDLVVSFNGRRTNTFEEKVDLLESVIIDDHILTFKFNLANFTNEIQKMKERYDVELRGVGHLYNSYTVPRQLAVSKKYYHEVYLKQREQEAEDYFMSEEFLENREIGKVIEDESK